MRTPCCFSRWFASMSSLLAWAEWYLIVAIWSKRHGCAQHDVPMLPCWRSMPLRFGVDSQARAGISTLCPMTLCLFLLCFCVVGMLFSVSLYIPLMGLTGEEKHSIIKSWRQHSCDTHHRDVAIDSSAQTATMCREVLLRARSRSLLTALQTHRSNHRGL